MAIERIIEARALTKCFAETRAVDGLSLGIREGICFGLLGPNGAGKTTTIEMLEGILPPSSGEIFFRARSIDRLYRERIGIQFQSTALQDRLTVREVLELFSSFYPKSSDPRELIAACDLGEFLDRDANHLSGGQRQRMLLAVSLINDPDLVFLDEPTTGLDPHARRQFWELIASVKKRGKTIVLTTHYMEEAYELCDEIAIMNRGKIIAEGAPDRLLREHFGGASLRLPRMDVTIDPERIPGKVYPLRGTADPDGEIEIQTRDVNETLKYLIEQGVSLAGLQIRRRDLEDLFLALTGGRMNEGAAEAL